MSRRRQPNFAIARPILSRSMESSRLPSNLCVRTLNEPLLSLLHAPTTAIYLNFTHVHIKDEFERKW
jgi:hypothetical protein